MLEEEPIKGDYRYLYIWYTSDWTHVTYYEYILHCDRSHAIYTRYILQFNVENTPGLVDSIFKIHLERHM